MTSIELQVADNINHEAILICLYVYGVSFLVVEGLVMTWCLSGEEVA